MCGQEFAPLPAVVTAIQARGQKSEVRDQKGHPDLFVEASAKDDPGLLGACPHCQHPLQFNPFFAAAEDYADLLRRGLEFSRREKGNEHEETLAHLAALAVYYEGIAKTTDVPSVARRAKEEVAEFQREHDALAAQLAAKQPVSASPP